MNLFRNALLCGMSFMACASALLATPVITSVSPNRGPVTTQTPIKITGRGFSGATSVQFGPNTVSIPANSSDTEISMLTPIATPATPFIVPGTFDIQVGGSSLTPDDQFTFQGPWKAYVGDSAGQVFVIDLSTNTMIGSAISVSPPAGGLNIISITPDGQFAYCPDNTTSAINIIRLGTNTTFQSPLSLV